MINKTFIVKDNTPDLFIILCNSESTIDKQIIEELNVKNIPVKILVRNIEGAKKFKTKNSTLVETEVNQPKTFRRHLEGINTVLSTLSNPSGKKSLFDICLGYQDNIKLLEEAAKSGVKKFIYVTDANIRLHKDPKVLEAKTKFISRLKTSGIDYEIVNAD